MHFFYLDETGCTGADLNNAQQPVFVLGGISVKAQGWRETTDQFRKAIERFFAGAVAERFELHATDLVNGQGAFAGYTQEQRNSLAYKLLDIIAERKHSVHFVGINKASLAAALPGEATPWSTAAYLTFSVSTTWSATSKGTQRRCWAIRFEA